ncbi:MAG: hypothetical protein Kow0059_02070 [Candidatus Sumerlaeia bacterium]
MMRPVRCFVLMAVFWGITAAPLLAQWQQIVPGIDYRNYSLTTPRTNKVFVTRMDRSTTSVIIDASLANGKISQPNVSWNTETVSAQAGRYDGAFGYWGRTTARYRYNVVVAINGNGFSLSSGHPDSAMVIGGALVKRTFGSSGTEQGGAMGFLYKLGGTAPTPGTPYLGGDLYLPTDQSKNRISFADNSWLQFHKINDQPQADKIIIYTHHYGAKTPTTSNVMEVVVQTQDAAPLRILPWSNKVPGTAVEINSASSGGTVIPFDGYVIVASGDKIAGLAAKIPSVGTTVNFSQETRDVVPSAWPSHVPVDYTNMYCAIGPMWGLILHNGSKSTSTSPSYITDIHPRTAVAFNANYIYFIVVDGRRTGWSEGMTLSELADWCISELGATDAVNNDGGGSSTMWIDGQIVNMPSDGSTYNPPQSIPRAVANGLMMIQLEPKEVSTAFSAGQTVYANTPSSSLYLRTGPGLHFHVIQSVPHLTPLTIVAHDLNGLRAQDVAGGPGYWWKVQTSGGVVGWACETYLVTIPAEIETWQRY